MAETGPVPVLCHPIGAYRRPELAGRGHVYSGSVKGRCIVCRALVWIGPRSADLVECGAAAPVCVDCVADQMERGSISGTVVCLGNPEGSDPSSS